MRPLTFAGPPPARADYRRRLTIGGSLLSCLLLSDLVVMLLH